MYCDFWPAESQLTSTAKLLGEMYCLIHKQQLKALCCSLTPDYFSCKKERNSKYTVTGQGDNNLHTTGIISDPSHIAASLVPLRNELKERRNSKKDLHKQKSHWLFVICQSKFVIFISAIFVEGSHSLTLPSVECCWYSTTHWPISFG